MKLLVLSSDTVDAARVRSALPGEELSGAEVLVISPAVNQSKLAFWMSDADEAIADAEGSNDASVAALRDEGARVSGEVGESEPMLALQDALATFQADRVLLLTGGEELEREAAARFDVPVSRA